MERTIAAAFRIPPTGRSSLAVARRAIINVEKIQTTRANWEVIGHTRAEDGNYYLIQAVVLYDPKKGKK